MHVFKTEVIQQANWNPRSQQLTYTIWCNSHWDGCKNISVR